jgi:PmbA protein
MSDFLKSQLEQILSMAKKRNAQDAEVLASSSEDTPVVFEANRLKQLQTNQSMLVGLRTPIMA